MKKLVLLAMLALAGTASADNLWNKGLTYSAETSGAITENGAYMVGFDPANVGYRMVKVNPDGSIATSGGSSTVTGNVSITASVPLTVTAYPAGDAFGSLTWNAASLVAYTAISRPAYTVLTGTVTTVNVTNAAGVSGVYDIGISANYGANAGIRYAFSFDAVAPSDLCSGIGNYVAATATTQVWPSWGPGAHVHMCSQGTGPTGNNVTVNLMRNQRVAP